MKENYFNFSGFASEEQYEAVKAAIENCPKLSKTDYDILGQMSDMIFNQAMAAKDRDADGFEVIMQNPDTGKVFVDLTFKGDGFKQLLTEEGYVNTMTVLTPYLLAAFKDAYNIKED